MSEEKEYTRLPGSGAKGLRTRARLFAGEDHLLCIYNTGYIETYKRFYYKDISAIVACKTDRGKNWNVVFGGIALIFLLLAYTSMDLWSSTSLKMSGVFLLFLFVNYLRGPTCKTYLRTAASEEVLPSLNRLKTALKTMDSLRLRIQTVQGKITSEEIGERSSAMHQDAPRIVKPVGPSSPAFSQKENYNGKFHGAFFSLLLTGGALNYTAFFWTGMTLTMLEALAGSALLIFGVTSIIKQHSSGMKGGLLFVSWFGLCYLFFCFIANYFVFMFLGLRHPGIGSNQWELLKLYSTLSPYDNPFLEWFYIVSITFSFGIGVAGLVLLRNYRRRIV